MSISHRLVTKPNCKHKTLSLFYWLDTAVRLFKNCINLIKHNVFSGKLSTCIFWCFVPFWLYILVCLISFITTISVSLLYFHNSLVKTLTCHFYATKWVAHLFFLAKKTVSFKNLKHFTLKNKKESHSWITDMALNNLKTFNKWTIFHRKKRNNKTVV